MSPLLSLSNVVVGYDAEPVLRAISLDVPEGALVAIVGPSGCGKTTLLRTIAGLVRARSGEIRLGRRMVTTHGIHLAPEKRRIGWVPQDAALFPHLTVAENVAFGLGAGKKTAIGGVRGAARKAARSERVRHLLALVDLTALADRLPAQLSGGQAQRVALARALAGVPDVVLLDEPFGALDPLLRAELRTEVRALLRAEGVTGILVTHDQAEALSVADYVAVMRAGEILQFGRPEDVYRRPATPWVAGFVGEAVFLPGVWTDGAVHCALGRLDADWVAGPAPHEAAAGAAGTAAAKAANTAGAASVAAAANTAGAAGTASTAGAAAGEHATAIGQTGEIAGASVTVLVRPEEIEIGPLTDDPARTATVAGVSYTGHDAMLELILDDGRSILSRVTAAELRPAGARVSVRVRGRVLAYPAHPAHTPAD